jgi:hypothetical protein
MPSRAASERITSYDSEIYIRKDRVLEVTENITVLADDQKILHGIYRDFPAEVLIIMYYIKP